MFFVVKQTKKQQFLSEERPLEDEPKSICTNESFEKE